MKKLFLASTISFVANDISKHIRASDLKLVHINTAAEVEEGDLWWLRADRKALEDIGFEVTDYTFTGKTGDQIEKDLSVFDAIFISGGNTFYLLEQIQRSGCTGVIKRFIDDGKIYLGSSAGSLIAGPNIISASGLDDEKLAPNLKGYKGLGLVDFVIVPHWGSEHFKERQISRDQVENLYGIKDKIIVLNDNQYVKVEDNMYQIVDTTQTSK